MNGFFSMTWTLNWPLNSTPWMELRGNVWKLTRLCKKPTLENALVVIPYPHSRLLCNLHSKFVDTNERSIDHDVRVDDILATAELLVGDMPDCQKLLNILPVYKRQQDSYNRIMNIVTHLLHLLTLVIQTHQPWTGTQWTPLFHNLGASAGSQESPMLLIQMAMRRYGLQHFTILCNGYGKNNLGFNFQRVLKLTLRKKVSTIYCCIVLWKV